MLLLTYFVRRPPLLSTPAVPLLRCTHDKMPESAGAASQTTTISPLAGPSSFGTAFDAQGLPTVHEVAHHRISHDFNDSMDHRLQSIIRGPSAGSGASRNGSAGSSIGRSFDDKLLEAPPLPHGYSAQIGAGPNPRKSFEENDRGPITNGNGNYSHQEISKMDQHRRLSKANASKRDKKGGFRNTIRRMFGIQRSPKDRISMPNPAVYPPHNPEEFITSATEVNTKTQRSASVPANVLPRRSALSSHPPLRHTFVSTTTATTPPQVTNPPPPPEHRPPERPPRPRSASVPSVLIKDMQAIEAALAANPNAQVKEEQTVQEVDTQNIGFAVTNGSNPKRRSRSVGAFPSMDHRMSPIQWHHVRRRSDEIRYWRESTQLSCFSGLKSIGSLEDKSPILAKGDLEGNVDETVGATADENGLGEHNQQFNFGLPAADAMQMQNQERMGLEERLITLEIKLMDFEYALSKLQAGSISSRQNSHLETLKRQASVRSYLSLDQQQTPIEPSPAIAQGDPVRSISRKPSIEDLMNPKPRPTSVATTIKQGPHQGIYTSAEKPPIDLSMRSSLTSLTIEHYTTLIALIRHEQSARQRLEEQITQLQAQVDRQGTQQRSHSNHPSSSQHSHTFSQSSRRHGMVDAENLRRGPYLHQRPRSSSYSTNETTTDDDDDYHDVYVTPDITPVDHPIERGEYERGAFDRMPIGEGVAF